MKILTITYHRLEFYNKIKTIQCFQSDFSKIIYINEQKQKKGDKI